MRPSARFARGTVLVVATFLALASCGGSGASVMGDMMAVASGGGIQVVVKRALVAALQKAGIPRPDNFVNAIFTFRNNRKEAARLFLEGARDNGLDRDASNRILEVIAGLATVAQLAGGGDIAGQIREFAVYMRGLDLPTMMASFGGPTPEGPRPSGAGAFAGSTRVIEPRTSETGAPAATASTEPPLPVATSPEFHARSYIDAAGKKLNLRPVPGKSGYLYLRANPAEAQVVLTSSPPDARKLLVLCRSTAVVPSGCSTVEVSAARFETAIGVVCVRPDEVARVDVVLQPKVAAMGRLTVLSNPPEAYLWVDGQVRGTTPQTIEEITEGIHDVRVFSADKSMTQRVEVLANGVVVVQADLLAGGAVQAPQRAAPQPASPLVDSGGFVASQPGAPQRPPQAAALPLDSGRVETLRNQCGDLCMRYAHSSARAKAGGPISQTVMLCVDRCRGTQDAGLIECLATVSNRPESAVPCDQWFF